MAGRSEAIYVAHGKNPVGTLSLVCAVAHTCSGITDNLGVFPLQISVLEKKKGAWTKDKINLRRVYLCPVCLQQAASGMLGQPKGNVTVRACIIAWLQPNLSFHLLISACDPEATGRREQASWF